MNRVKKNRVGAVVIGRNEGQRLVTCFSSLQQYVGQIIYVDSGSSDNSLEEANNFGIESLSLDLSTPFTAARARNEGAFFLVGTYPDIEFIQFIDGDCEVQPDWISTAETFLDENLQYAVACGRRRERFPEQTIYNQLCDIEWNTPIGDALSCGGDALIRVSAFKKVNGYRDTLIAGEEPEMCFRLRAMGWKIRRIDAEMTLHDAGMTQLLQWWNRARRAGYAYSEGAYLHGNSEEKFKVKEVLSITAWGIVLPVLIMSLCFYESSSVLLLLVYPLQIIRLILVNNKQLRSFSDAYYYAISNVFGKTPQLLGAVQFLFNKWRGQRGKLIEYK